MQCRTKNIQKKSINFPEVCNCPFEQAVSFAHPCSLAQSPLSRYRLSHILRLISSISLRSKNRVIEQCFQVYQLGFSLPTYSLVPLGILSNRIPTICRNTLSVISTLVLIVSRISFKCLIYKPLENNTFGTQGLSRLHFRGPSHWEQNNWFIEHT